VYSTSVHTSEQEGNGETQKYRNRIINLTQATPVSNICCAPEKGEDTFK
jgi:hypothetical protein